MILWKLEGVNTVWIFLKEWLGGGVLQHLELSIFAYSGWKIYEYLVF